MNNKSRKSLRPVAHQHRGLALVIAGGLGVLAAPSFAAPAADSAYATDPQQSWVNDRSAEPIRQVNNIMCYIDGMKPARLVNQGPYAALIDGKKCEDDGSSADSSNTGTTYKRVIVDSSRLEGQPMRAKIWVPQDAGDGGGASTDIFVNASATEAPSASNPNGVFRLDYCAPMPDGSCFVNGRLEGLVSGIRYVERERGGGGGGGGSGAGGVNTLRMFVARTGETGSGAVARDVPGNASETLTYQFAYDANYFRRVKQGATSEDACFDRSLSHGKSSAFRYGLYTEAGERVERNGGFPVTTVVNGQTVQGFAGYWGLNFQGSVQSQIADGATVTKQNFDNRAASGESYTLTKVAGRLMKFTKQEVPVADAKNLPVNVAFWNGLSDATASTIQPGSNGATFRGRGAEVYWDADLSRLMISSLQNCNQNGCNTSRLPAPVPFSVADANLYRGGLQGYSQMLGGEVSVPGGLLTALAAADLAALADAKLVVRVSDVVYPGSPDAPAQLYCVNNCTTAAGLQALASGGAQHPFGNTRDAFMNVDATVAYTFGADGKLMTSGAAVVWPASFTAQQAGQWSNGVRTGKMLPAQATFQCPNDIAHGMDPSKFCANAADAADVFYAWETGPNAWNQFAGLKGGDGSYLRFDAPLNVSWNVPNRAEFGEYRGTVLRLQYNGFGDLWGIPATCVNSATNQVVDCSEGGGNNDIRWVPSLTIPDTLNEGVVAESNGSRYLVKWLNREVRFAKVADSFCSALTVGSLSNLPSAEGLSNPASAADPLYIGAKPEVTAPPRVVGGVVKY